MSESKSGYVAFREFKNGTSASVIEMTYGKGRICHGRTDQWDQEFDRQY